ncbi:DUF4253 domain-containing protein [Streptomyces sp. NPDC020780]|uniref:DUF4253 domain-containing protein n=1 Tax=unclassified Streptomyces TaxID=2593676 RepID=UPI0037A859CB
MATLPNSVASLSTSGPDAPPDRLLHGTRAAARTLAAEHFAFCPDTIEAAPPNGLDAYAEKHLLGQETWSFWWD